MSEQATLSGEQLKAFYHEGFVEEQVRDFRSLVGSSNASGGQVVDVGGGCGFFARRLAEVTGRKVKVIDADAVAIQSCRDARVDATLGDALDPPFVGHGNIVTFNLILHHLIGSSESITRELQIRALAAWRPVSSLVFVNEYIYESFLGNFSGWAIFRITGNQLLSWIGSKVGKVIPALRANTFGVGVRFRAHEEWCRLFSDAGYSVEAYSLGRDEDVPLPLRLLLIKAIRRDSFLLSPRHQEQP